ncbi:ABC transporter permease [Jannaschia pagri]|uniref:ABC transporter permease n=1 Tax=Jannaschia pagri TaxID=2829797 RepID=A0ABQ4NJP2_9RHOB|nr:MULTISPECIES: ABC transporter permease [unclassified Jannaschia]GIT90792.1 ABC transporter permease [Jannaschia sp. AI_61]GIT94624.1 ABC transporter permease [Jannaschia sp. AI_62]
MSRAVDIFVATVVGLGLWQGAVWLLAPPPFILPPPLKVFETLVSSRVLLAENAWVTVLEVLIGLALGVVLGSATAIGLAMSDWARKVTMPMLVFSQAIPVFAIAPLLTLWFGYGLGSKIVMTLLIIYFPVTSSFYDGLSRTDRGALDLARSMNATPWRTLWHLRVPLALPSLSSGLRMAAVYAPIGAVIGEWVGASRGLGYLMLLANGRAKTDLMFASLLVLAVFTILLHAAVNRLADRIDRYATGA